MLRKLLIA